MHHCSLPGYRPVVLLLVCLVIPSIVLAQRYAVINYTTENGFPGHIAYSVSRDSRGYVWIGSENGLVRFNGYEFKTYTTKDGLPDNEVFGVTEDSLGRLWLNSFANSACYLWKEKISTITNNKILSGMYFDAHIDQIICDREGSYWFSTRKEITHLSPGGRFRRLLSFSDPKRKVALGKTSDGAIWLTADAVLYEYRNHKWRLIRKLDSSYFVIGQYGTSWIFRTDKKKELIIGGPPGDRKIRLPPWSIRPDLKMFPFFIKDQQPILPVTFEDDLYFLNVRTGRLIDSVCNIGVVNSCDVLEDGSWWVSTRGKGVFHFVSTPVRSWASSGIQRPVLFIKGHGDSFYASIETGDFVTGRLANDQLYVEQSLKLIPTFAIKRHNYLGRDKAGNWITGHESLCKFPKPGHRPLKEIETYVKSYYEEDSGHVLLGSIEGLYRLDKDSFIIKDTLLRNRTTAISKIGDVVYAGTLSGLYACIPGRKAVLVFQKLPILRERIPALCPGNDSTLWIASAHASVMAMRKGAIVAFFNTENQLQCNTIYCLKASEHYIWVGTDKGLFAISQSQPYTIVRHLGYSNGLISDQVNCLDIQDGRVWAGTAKGISTFKEQDIVQKPVRPTFLVNSIKDGDSLITELFSPLVLRGKTLTIDFDVIDFSGSSKPAFQYRINNDGKWLNLESSMLYFPSTPYDSFSVSIRALSPNWNTDNKLILHFFRPSPLYLRGWFVIGVALCASTLLAVAAISFVRRVRKKDKEKMRIQQNLLQLEQMALQGQMNPHFIFNCITAIQHFYADEDTDRADLFVDKFAALIRQTFEMTSSTFVSLEQELNYLQQYLDIEGERFNHTFSSRISTDLELPVSQIPVPAMLLQPFVENAVRHGVRHLPDGTGKIHISARQLGQQIELVVSDNGIGRERSRQMRSGHRLFTTLTSTTVNKKRIEILNKLFGGKINVVVEDLLNENQETEGTVVRIVYPLNIDRYAN